MWPENYPKFTEAKIVNATVFETQTKLKQLNLELNNRKLSNLFAHRNSLDGIDENFFFTSFKDAAVYFERFDNEMREYDNPISWRRPVRYIFFHRDRER